MLETCWFSSYEFDYFEARDSVAHVICGECNGMLYPKLLLLDYNNVSLKKTSVRNALGVSICAWLFLKPDIP